TIWFEKALDHHLQKPSYISIMVEGLHGSLRLLSYILLLRFQLVVPQASIEHRK
ncbi:hypothetical protein NDU88_006151, partial [Pleurodeles waltl]